MKIAVACDHGALDLKNKVKAHLEAQGHEVEDFITIPLSHLPSATALAAGAA